MTGGSGMIGPGLGARRLVRRSLAVFGPLAAVLLLAGCDEGTDWRAAALNACRGSVIQCQCMTSSIERRGESGDPSDPDYALLALELSGHVDNAPEVAARLGISVEELFGADGENLRRVRRLIEVCRAR